MPKNFDVIEHIKGELFEYALFYGMTSDEYWYGDPSLFFSYQNAFERKQEYDLMMAWKQGDYFSSALGSTQVWTTSPFKDNDWNKMPKYVDPPKFSTQQREEISPEKQKLIEKAKAKLTSLGLLRKEN